MILLEQLSRLGIGTSRAGSLGSRLSTDQFGDIIRLAADNCINLIDTADTYGSGDSERLINKCIANNRSSFFVMTKAGIPMFHTPEWLSPLNQIGKKIKIKAGVKKNYTANYLLNSIRQSNKRLGVESANAFMLHEPVWDELVGTNAWEGLELIRQAGLADYTGVSTNDYRVVEEGIRSGQVQLVQTAVSWQDNSANAIIDLCRAHQIPVVANQVLRPYKSLVDRFAATALERSKMDGLESMSLIQFLIAAVLTEKKVDAVLFGTSDLAHLKHNIASLDYTKVLPRYLPTLNQLLA
ncbi:aldo/keto reductase [Spirosoma jeollabukense]